MNNQRNGIELQRVTARQLRAAALGEVIASLRRR